MRNRHGKQNEIARLASLLAERDRELAAAKERIGKLEDALADARDAESVASTLLELREEER